MALLTKQTSKRTANDLTWAAATSSLGDTFANSGRECLLVNNGGGASIDVTVDTPATADGLAIESKVIAVGAGKIAMLGPWPKATYNDGDGLVKATCSSVSSVTLAVVDVARS
jgi:hypothetical protein